MKRLVIGLMSAVLASASLLVGAAPSGAATAPSTAPVGDSEVRVVDPATGLTTEIHSMVDPAAAAALRQQLRGQGAQVLPAGVTVSAKVAATCQAYGTARQWCGHAWAYNDYNDPQVYFLDHTPSGYPVTDAVADWYQSPGIDAYYRWYTAGCPNTRVHCVSVSTYHPASSGEFGVTYWDPAQPTRVTVQISDRLRNTTQGRKSTCHELGHALALDHNASNGSCMFTGRAFQTGDSYRPSSQDFTVLSRIYPKPGT